MNNRYIYKAKRKDNNEWVEGYLYITHNGEYEISRYDQDNAGYCSVGWYIAPLKSIAIYPKDYLVDDIQPGLNQEDILKSSYPMEVIGNIHDNIELLEMER